MKTIITAAILALAAFSAQAKTIATVPNSVGGTINFTTEVCNASQSLPGQHFVWGFNPNSGVTITGCGFYDEGSDTMIVRWNNGESIAIPFKRLHIAGYQQGY